MLREVLAAALTLAVCVLLSPPLRRHPKDNTYEVLYKEWQESRFYLQTQRERSLRQLDRTYQNMIDDMDERAAQVLAKCPNKPLT